MTDSTQSASTDQQLLAHYLSVREDHCPSCHYNIHQLTTDTCPECGEKLKLQIALQTPKLAAFIVGLVALSFAAGFPLLFAALIVFVSLIDYVGSNPLALIGTLTFFGVVFCVPLLLWCRNKHALIRSTNRYRWWLAILSWLLSPIAIVGVYVIMESIR